MIKTPKAGIVTVIGIAMFVSSALWALMGYASVGDVFSTLSDPYYLHVTQFSFYQATVSTVLSVGLAIPVAQALSCRHFPGRALFLKFCASTLVLPVLVGVFGVLAVYGNQGVLASLVHYWGGEWSFSIYGLNGILLAHVFFNLPFATRLLLQSIEGIPMEQRQLASHLGMNRWQVFRLIEWPRLREHLPHIVGLVFMLCFTSFATVMALGGGPKATTIELAIYQAIKFDFDLQTGAILALWQMVICAGLVLFIHRFSRQTTSSVTHQTQPMVNYQDSLRAKLWDWSWIVLAMLLVAPPLAMVLISGLNSITWQVLQDNKFWQALLSSLQIATISASLALLCGVLILNSSRALRLKQANRVAEPVELMGTIILVTPSLVISTGTFLLLRQFTDVFSLALFVVIVVNALMALPYVIKSLNQPMLLHAKQYHLLWQSLGMRGVRRFLLMEWYALRMPLIHAFSISFVLSIGDLTVIALFGSQNFNTLPLYLYQLLGSYQMEAAAVVSLVLLLISVGTFSMLENMLARRAQDAKT